MTWKVRINFSDGDSEMFDEDFESQSAAEEAIDLWMENFHAGGKVLELMGEGPADIDEIESFSVWKE